MIFCLLMSVKKAEKKCRLKDTHLIFIIKIQIINTNVTAIFGSGITAGQDSDTLIKVI